NPFKGFLPSPGKITTYMPAGGPGVRVDSAVYPEYQIPPYYDSMVAKLISYGRNREEAIKTMKRALEEFVVEGVHTTIPFHALIMDHDVFKSSDFNTDFLKEHPIELDNLKESRLIFSMKRSKKFSNSQKRFSPFWLLCLIGS